jgi:hypothetical protein
VRLAGVDRPGRRRAGIVVQNHQNYAQDLLISSRGFGARSQFGVRGVRLITDGIPATMPDGQGQPATIMAASCGNFGRKPRRTKITIVINSRNNQLPPSDLLDDRSPPYSSSVFSSPRRLSAPA